MTAELRAIAGQGETADEDAAPTGSDGLRLSDAGNAARLVQAHGADLRFVHPWTRWLVHDGQRYRPDETGAATRRMLDTLASLVARANQLLDPKERARMIKHAIRSEQAARVAGALTLAASLEGVPVLPEDLDADPWAFNCLNGTVDLRTGKLRPHNRADLITKLAPVEYDPDAKCPGWLEALDLYFAGDQVLIEFLRRLVGYSLTGLTSGQVLAILYGSGTNGKSTFVDVLHHVFGDYAHQAPAEMLMHRDRGRGGATPELADLHGRRFVAAIETGDGRRLDEALIKQLTGGDKIRARQLYAHAFTFQPTHKLWLATNHRPEVHGTDEAIWRRLLLIPFEVTIPPEKQEDQTQVVERLAAEANGILAWAVKGCLQWHLLVGGYQGLDVPDRVKAANAEYRADMDSVAAFLEECCIRHPEAKVKSSDLYTQYGYWAAANGADALSQKTFSLRLRDKGYARAKRKDGVWLLGIGVEHHSAMQGEG